MLPCASEFSPWDIYGIGTECGIGESRADETVDYDCPGPLFVGAFFLDLAGNALGLISDAARRCNARPANEAREKSLYVDLGGGRCQVRLDCTSEGRPLSGFIALGAITREFSKVFIKYRRGACLGHRSAFCADVSENASLWNSETFRLLFSA